MSKRELPPHGAKGTRVVAQLASTWEKPAHPATMQRSASIGRPPHPATAQRRELLWLGIQLASRRPPGVVQKTEATGGFETPKSKKKPKLTPKQKLEKRQKMSSDAFDAAEEALSEMKPVRADSTICVLMSSDAKPIAYGESGWNRNGWGREIRQYLCISLVAQKGQEHGYGGLVCAESHAVVQACAAKQIQFAKYSLAFDQKFNYYKSACKSCSDLLKRYNIEDLWDE